MARARSLQSKPRIAVVGAGAAGLFAARALAERGADVTALDASAGGRRPAASAVAAGMLSPFAEHLQSPAEAHPRLTEAGAESLGLWRAEFAHMAAFPGSLALAQGAERLTAAIDLARALGEDARLLTAQERAALEPDLEAQGRICGLFAGEGRVSPEAGLAQLARAVRDFGGVVRGGAVATAAEARPDGVRLRLLGPDGPGTLDADFLLLAPGAWADAALTAAAPELSAVRPCRGQLLRLPAAGARLSHMLRRQDLYLVPAPEAQAILVGATMEFDRTDIAIDPAVAHAQAQAAQRALPGLDAQQPGQAAVGVRGMTPDWAPLVGWSAAPRTLVAAGLSRNGWLLAPFCAQIIAACVYEEALTPLMRSFDPGRFVG